MSGVAVVTVAHGRHDHLAGQRLSLDRSARTPDAHVVVAMDDPHLVASGIARVVVDTTPQGLPLAAARNRGADEALRLGADVVVFLDVDCLVGPSLLGAYADAVRGDPETVWSGPVTYLDPPPRGGYDLDRLDELDSPHPARPAPAPGELTTGADPALFWSLSFACSSAAWKRTDGFCEDYAGYGGEDTDFARVVDSVGLGLGWVGAARAFHQWHPVSRPPVEHLADIVRNAEIFRSRWGEIPMRGWLDEFERRGLARTDEQGRWRVVAPG
ncbi:glycosyltransferase family 2 protein [Nocardioides currus]|uniref:glycosyltransferase family 2 protein n=1 Tax=Nocardioides currus TaxID=2133958 RepID=UPI001A9C4EEC|nr:galactosyltransferase-related protein [Nocardioides currus]